MKVSVNAVSFAFDSGRGVSVLTVVDGCAVCCAESSVSRVSVACCNASSGRMHDPCLVRMMLSTGVSPGVGVSANLSVSVTSYKWHMMVPFGAVINPVRCA